MNYLCSLGGNKKQKNKLMPKSSQIKPKEMGAVNIKTKYFRILYCRVQKFLNKIMLRVES